jgi:hypothetical protein
MATLVSPGVDIEIIDESFYASAGPGTVPLIVFATASNKTAPSGSGIAPYTVPSQAGTLFLATSQRELIQNYGNPLFKNVQGTPVHGDETNEFGLMAAYQYLGISNQAYVLRANIDLSSLLSSTSAPVGPPAAGTYWLDLTNTTWGVFQSTGNPSAGLAWQNQQVLAATAATVVTVDDVDVPASSFGTNGQFAVVVTMSNNLIYEKISGAWYQVGSTDWASQRPTTITGRSSPPNVLTSDAIVIDGQMVSFSTGAGSAADVVSAINAAAIPNIIATVSGSGAVVIKDTTGVSITISNSTGTPLTTLGIAPGTFPGVTVYYTNNAQYPANSISGSVWIKGSAANNGAAWSVKLYNATTATFSSLSAPFYPFNSSLDDGIPSKDQAAINALGNTAIGNIYVGFDASNGTQQLRRWNGTIWQNLVYEAGTIAPTTDPTAGSIWYNTNFAADIMYGDGNQWLGYSRKFPSTDPNGAIISGSQPLQQSGGGSLVDNDLWIDSSDLENYPLIYRYDATAQTWTLIDNSDQTSPFGIVFADARADSGTTFTGIGSTSYQFGSTAPADLVQSNFVEPDAPDPRTFPDGMLLFNTRVSTYNVKEWNPTYFAAGGFDPHTDYTKTTYQSGNGSAVFPALSSAGRWVTASGNNTDGSPFMGRKAQRVMVVRALEAAIADNDSIRSELVYFNLVAVPGYPELMTEMVSLNVDNKQVAFNIGDTPIRLAPDGTSISNWANNAKDVAATGEDGLTVADDYTGVYYPWGLSTDLSGNEIMMPPSSIALCTIAYNDQVAYPWYAPAGFRRGLVTNASSVGYLTTEGEYLPVILNPGQRDVIYTNKINPIAYIPGRGLVVFGQKTLEPTGTSALDRINVARLANYVAYQLDILVKPFLFEQNDSQTQASAQAVVNSFLNGLVGLQALSDYAVVCDSSNNTSDRVDADELWIDVAIKPLHSIEFIYVPVRILNTGADLATAISSTVSL